MLGESQREWATEPRFMLREQQAPVTRRRWLSNHLTINYPLTHRHGWVTPEISIDCRQHWYSGNCLLFTDWGGGRERQKTLQQFLKDKIWFPEVLGWPIESSNLNQIKEYFWETCKWVCIFEHTLVCLLFFFHQACLFETDQLQRRIEET